MNTLFLSDSFSPYRRCVSLSRRVLPIQIVLKTCYEHVKHLEAVHRTISVFSLNTILNSKFSVIGGQVDHYTGL